MARKSRLLSASGIYHIMWRGINRQQIFHDDADNIQFLCMLNLIQSNEFQVLAYCLMGNHVHLLVKTPTLNENILSNKLKTLGIKYVSYYNKRYQRNGPLFQDRYKSQPVENRRYLFRVLRYIHKNPVEASITDDLMKYQWSSYIDYFSRRDKICHVHINYVFSFCKQEWLREYHNKDDINNCGIIDIDTEKKKFSDKQIRELIEKIYLIRITDIPSLPEDEKRTIVRNIIFQENIKVSQLARLSGIPKGEISRYLL